MTRTLGPGARRCLLACAVLVAVVLSSVQCRPAPPTGENLVRVRLKWLHQSQFAGFYAAQQKELYRKEGLDVVLNPGGVDFPAISLVETGSDDVGVAGADQVLLARAQGKPIVALAVIYRRTPFCLFSFTKANLGSLGKMVDKKIGVKLGGNEEFTYRAMLARAIQRGEVPPGTFTLTGKVPELRNEIPVKYDLGPFLSGEIDAWPGYSINEPLLAKARSGQDVEVLRADSYGLRIYADVLFATEQAIRERPNTIRRFVRATQQGWKYAMHPSNQDEIVSFVLRYAVWSNQAHETAMLAASRDLVQPPNAPPIGVMTLDEWRQLHDVMIQYGFLPKAVDVATVFTNDFLQ